MQIREWYRKIYRNTKFDKLLFRLHISMNKKFNSHKAQNVTKYLLHSQSEFMCKFNWNMNEKAYLMLRCT